MDNKYAVDSIIGNIALIENLSTKEKKKININTLNFKVKENDILIYDGYNYIKDDYEKNKRILSIKEKMERLRRW